ncbi:MAG: hypothetical protein ACT6RD_00120 [Brevundimonas sp.]|uniref:hypothetical protein n=1 Tax=Brevundimonas sp. TaxID=1871086 RepID=UPI00403403F9
MADGTIPVWFHTALAVGAIASPIAAYLVARKNVSAVIESANKQIKSAQKLASDQIVASVISANRQKWLDAVRDDISEFVSELQALRGISVTSASYQKDKSDVVKRLRFLHTRIQLRLNPDKEDQNEIIKDIDLILENIGSPDVDQRIDALVLKGQTLFRSVWKKVKTGS